MVETDAASRLLASVFERRELAQDWPEMKSEMQQAPQHTEPLAFLSRSEDSTRLDLHAQRS